jgi:hypothetical protein
MLSSLLVGFGILILPALAIMIDGLAGIYSRGRRYTFGDTLCYDLRLLVPIWGDVKYLLNVSELARYKSHVTLCTTGDESPSFYRALREIAAAHGFKVFIDRPLLPRHAARGQGAKARSTGGTTRDRLICTALNTVTESYVIPLDADSIPAQRFEVLAGELKRRHLDLASVRIIPSNPTESLLTRLQALEYRVAMQIKFVAPWMLSGACHAARTEVLRDVMSRHSLFFQGNDVEAGIIAHALGYRVGFIPFDILSDVPAKIRPWTRQRLAWAGGQFRLFIVNIRFARWHLFMWVYGAAFAYLTVILRWQSFTQASWRILATVLGYLALVLFLYMHDTRGKWWVLAMPLYTFISSFIITPLGLFWYTKMALASGNWGVIRPHRQPRRREVDTELSSQAVS